MQNRSRKQSRKPSKSKLRKASDYISNNQRKDSDEMKREQISKMLEAQRFVDEWNNVYVGKLGMDEKDLSKHFDNVQLDKGMVVHMFMENPIKRVGANAETKEVVSIEYGIRQIDMRNRNTDAAKWGPTPFPVINKAVIMAISPETKLWYHEQQERLAKYDPVAAASYIIPEVGDQVYLNHFLFKDARYYVDKQAQCEDFVKNQQEIRLNNFDFLFKISNYEIQSVIKRDKTNEVFDTQVEIEDRIIYREIPKAIEPVTESEINQENK